MEPCPLLFVGLRCKTRLPELLRRDEVGVEGIMEGFEVDEQDGGESEIDSGWF